MSKTILVTGAAGFIGSHTAAALLARGDQVVGLDNLNDYYDPGRKADNLRSLREQGENRFSFVEGDVRDRELVGKLFLDFEFSAVAHLAAMAGVRVSIEDPGLYYDVNVNGTLALLDAAVGRLPRIIPGHPTPPTFVLASTSSAYGETRRIPFVETDACDKPISPYASSKLAAEMLAYTYHHLYDLNVTALRFFTVYGPRNRPDMMAYKVMDNICYGKQVPLFNQGRMHRDWTYVEDIVQGVVAALDRPLGYEVVNLGRGEPVLLADFVALVERFAGRKAHLVPAPMPETDIPYTFADIGKARQLLGYAPTISVEVGISRLWQWYEDSILRSKPRNPNLSTICIK